MAERAAGTGSAGDRRQQRLLVVVTGSIMAAFMPTWISLIRADLRCSVRVVLTHSATELVSAGALSALTGHPVAGPDWQRNQSAGAEHVVLSKWADAVLVVPATANFCAKLSVGICDDLASTTVQSATSPTILVPSIPSGCLQRPATRRALGTLADDGYSVVSGGSVMSVTTGELEEEGPGSIDDVLRVLREHGLGAADPADPVGTASTADLRSDTTEKGRPE